MKYPNSIKKGTSKFIDYANRGMTLESDLNLTNEYYLNNNIAIIYKKPTPIKIVSVNFDNKKNATITEAYFKTPSTTDYNGIYKGNYIDFEAKEVKGGVFPLANINLNQRKHIKSIIEHNGIAFIIVRFSTHNSTFILRGIDLLDYIDNEERKSIPIDYFIKKGYRINESYIPRLNYIKLIDDIYLGGNYEKNI